MTTAEARPQYLLDRVVRVDSYEPASSSLTSRTAAPVVTMKVGYAAAWFRDAIDRLEDLASLAPGWDSYGAKSVAADMALAAVKFLAAVAAAAPSVHEPSIVPLSDGGIQVEWHRGGIDLEVEFSDDEPGVSRVDHTNGDTAERPLSDALSEVLRVATRLSAT